MARKKKNTGIIILLVIVLLGVIGAVGGYVVGAAKNDIEGKRQANTAYTLEITKSDYEYEIGKKLYDN